LFAGSHDDIYRLRAFFLAWNGEDVDLIKHLQVEETLYLYSVMTLHRRRHPKKVHLRGTVTRGHGWLLLHDMTGHVSYAARVYCLEPVGGRNAINDAGYSRGLEIEVCRRTCWQTYLTRSVYVLLGSAPAWRTYYFDIVHTVASEAGHRAIPLNNIARTTNTRTCCDGIENAERHSSESYCCSK
jgi:hypothetical protein